MRAYLPFPLVRGLQSDPFFLLLPGPLFVFGLKTLGLCSPIAHPLMNIFIVQHQAEKLIYIVHMWLLLLSLADTLREKMQRGGILP